MGEGTLRAVSQGAEILGILGSDGSSGKGGTSQVVKKRRGAGKGAGTMESGREVDSRWCGRQSFCEGLLERKQTQGWG